MNDRNIMESLFKLMYAVKTELSEQLSASGVSVAPMHIKLLKMLSVKAPCTAQNLAESLSRDKAQITRLVQDLLAAQLIERTPNPEDKRSQLLNLRQEALDVLKTMDSIENRIMDRMSSEVSEEEKQLFIMLANKFKNNLRPSEKSPFF